MKLLLDTHTYLWLLTEPKKVGAKATQLLYRDNTIVLVSVVSLIEIAIKSKKGRIDFDFNLVDDTLNSLSATIIDFNQNHAIELNRLNYYHQDPFDHLLIAQAIVEQATILTADEQIHRYPASWAWD